MHKARSQLGEETLAADARLSELLQHGRAGDEGAYRKFLTELAERLRRQMRARAGGLAQTDVEDLVQEILISVHVSRATWDETRPVLPWIAAVARYRLADHLRRRGRDGRLAREISALSETFVGSRANNTSEEIVNEMAMNSAMNDLSETERRAFTLVRVRGMSLDEAALFSGSTTGALKVAVHRAARKLQALFAAGRL